MSEENHSPVLVMNLKLGEIKNLLKCHALWFKFYLLILSQGVGNLITYHEDKLLATPTLNELVLTLQDQGSVFSMQVFYKHKHVTGLTSSFTTIANIVIGKQQTLQSPIDHFAYN